MEIIAKPKRWGNSFGFIIPKEVVKKENISTDTEIIVKVQKVNPIKEIFGSLKGWKINAQKFKDEMRSEEELAEKRELKKWKKLTS